MKQTEKASNEKMITRKDALRKAGKYALFTAAASMLLLSPRKAMADPSLPGWHGSVVPPGGGGSGSNNSSSSGYQTPFVKPLPSAPPTGLKDSPWK